MNNNKWVKPKADLKPKAVAAGAYVPLNLRKKAEPTFDEMFPAGLVAPIIKTNIWSGNFKAAIEKAPPGAFFFTSIIGN